MHHFSHVWHFATPWTVARQGPLSMGFSSHEYWSGLHSEVPLHASQDGCYPKVYKQ